MLDLFCGTGSVGDVFRAEGYEVISLDIEPKYKPTIVCDILQWDYKSTYPPGYFDVIFCCPPALTLVKLGPPLSVTWRQEKNWS